MTISNNDCTAQWFLEPCFLHLKKMSIIGFGTISATHSKNSISGIHQCHITLSRTILLIAPLITHATNTLFPTFGKSVESKKSTTPPNLFRNGCFVTPFPTTIDHLGPYLCDPILQSIVLQRQCCVVKFSVSWEASPSLHSIPSLSFAGHVLIERNVQLLKMRVWVPFL